MQALWMGVPVISIKGDNFCGRMGASMMHFLGLDDWIAESEEQYIEIVKEKVRQRDQLLTLKSTLRQRMLESPLCDTRGFTTELEQVFKKIWRQYCNKP
jgi:predicted O-linked N-acetylglucosamine transferase (SPINDLY family)